MEVTGKLWFRVKDKTEILVHVNNQWKVDLCDNDQSKLASNVIILYRKKVNDHGPSLDKGPFPSISWLDEY